MDADVKRGLEDFCAEVGMNVTTAINLFARAVIRDQTLPFEITTKPADPFYNAANLNRLTNQSEWTITAEPFTTFWTTMIKAWDDALGKTTYIGKARIERPSNG